MNGIFAIPALAAGLALAACANETAKPAAPSANACPPWVESAQHSHSNAESATLGCANALNLRHMVENPHDLKQGRDLGPADGARQAKAVNDYEEGKVKTTTGSAGGFAPTGTSGSGGQ